MGEMLTVEVGEDHLAGFLRTPRTALAELIWNALDASADRVKISFELNPVGGVEGVTISDDGDGMTPADASFGFRNFGNSWKRHATAARNGRALHGKFGRGRYTAFALGERAVWQTVGQESEEGPRLALRVRGTRTALKRFDLSEPRQTNEPTGTTVRIEQLNEKAQRALMQDGVLEELTTRFALYLEQYPGVQVIYRDKLLRAPA